MTLIEVLAASVVSAVAVVAAGYAMDAAVSTRATLDGDSVEASLVAREVYELARALPRAPSGSVAARNATELQALDSLVGALFQPPMRADKTRDNTRAAWKQDVQLELFSLDDLQTSTGEDPALGVPEGAERLYRVTVTVVDDRGTSRDFRWWLHP
jgi:hypothetical protein